MQLHVRTNYHNVQCYLSGDCIFVLDIYHSKDLAYRTWIYFSVIRDFFFTPKPL